jgi:hypothetical protein
MDSVSLDNLYTYFSGIFNTREQAYLFWGIPILIWLLSPRNTRKSVGGIVKALFCRQFVYIYIIALAYISCSIFLLHAVKIWDISLIKDTIMWFLFVALPLMFQAGKIDSFQKFLKEIVTPLIAFSIIFEYIFGLYTFKLWIEVLMVPALVMLGGMLAVSERKSEYAQVNKLLKGTQSFSGLIAVFFILLHLVQHYQEYVNRTVLMQFLMPLFLSLLFLPLLYGIAMFIHYETAFITLKRHFRHHTMYRYAMLMTMLRFNGDLEGMNRWKQMVFSKNLQGRSEIDEAITLIKTLQKTERNPHTVNEGLGWAPYQVKDLLISKGITTSEYKNNMDDEFCAISFPFKLNDESFLSDTLTYMVLGKQLVATELHLGVKIFYSTKNNSPSLLELLNCAELLYEGAFGGPLPKEIKAGILKSYNYKSSNNLANLTVKKELWHNKDMGYSLDFKITHIRHKFV